MAETERGVSESDDGSPTGLARKEAAREFDIVNETTMGLTEAKGALQRAIVIVTPTYKEEVPQ